jgi:hypothetical protein
MAGELCTKHGLPVYDSAGNCAVCIQEVTAGVPNRVQPYKCPVCDGSGKVSRPPWVAGDVNTWTSSGTEHYECQACKGTGIIWG